MIRRFLCALALAALSASGAAADDASDKVTLVYEHELPNVPSKSIKGVLVEYPPSSRGWLPYSSSIPTKRT